MTKEEALQDFFKSLKISLNNSSIYFQNHPIFIKSTQDLKEKINCLFNFINPIKIGVSASSLFMNDKELGKAVIYEEIARFFHFRKVKSIEIRDTLLEAELTYFLTQAALSPREILKNGGLERVLEAENVDSIAIEGLDYSQILQAQGAAYKDIWVYLFKDVIDRQDEQKINQLADNFAAVLGKFKLEDLLEDEELRQNLLNFLSYLKRNAPEKFLTCAKELAAQIMRFKEMPQDKIEKLRVFLKDLGPEGLADTLWQEIISDERFDVSSFNLFVNLVDKKQEEEIAGSLSKKASGVSSYQLTPSLRKKMRELFRLQAGQSLPAAYLKALARFYEDGGEGRSEPLILDRGAVQRNYRFLMLNIMWGESSKARLSQVLEKVSEEWAAMIKDRDFEFMKGFLEMMKAKEKDNPALSSSFNPFRKQILSFVETAALEEGELTHFEYFLQAIAESSFSKDDYLKKIFSERRVNPRALQLYLKLFPQGIPEFNACLRRSTGLDFLKEIIEALSLSHSPLGLIILKYIFSFSHLLIKIEALKAMRGIETRDNEFLFSVLKLKDAALKREAFLLLSADSAAQEEALAIIFDIFNPFGIRNNIIEENIEIAAQDKSSPKVEQRLKVLSARRFFWNKNIRKAALAALEA